MTDSVFRSARDLQGYLFRIQDNGGDSADRYTVVFSDGDFLSLSSDPSHPCGVSLWGEGIDPAHMNEWAEEGRAVDLALGDLPAHLQQHILSRCNEAWRDFLEAVEAGEPYAVAPSRELAEENDGTHRCAGKGIYAAGSGYCVRLDGRHAGDDRGPFMTAREAVLATLPDEYSLAGPEYQSPLDVARTRRTKGVAAQIRALEKRVAAADEGLSEGCRRAFGVDAQGRDLAAV